MNWIMPFHVLKKFQLPNRENRGYNITCIQVKVMCCQSNPPRRQSAFRAVTRTSEPEKRTRPYRNPFWMLYGLFLCKKRERTIKDEMENRLMEVRYQDEAQKISLTGYADTLIMDRQQDKLVGIRVGGYSEVVSGLAAAICGGGTVTVHRNTSGQRPAATASANAVAPSSGQLLPQKNRANGCASATYCP